MVGDRCRDAADGVTPSPGFVVFDMDYRLACTGADDDLVDHYCGWGFGTPGDDVEYAVAWVRANVTNYPLSELLT